MSAERIALRGGAGMLARGHGDGTPIVFLHGLAGAAWSWEPQAVALAPGRPTYAWEARGHGATPRVRDAGLAEQYDDAAEALNWIGAVHGRRTIVAGHSLGGLLALALGAACRDRIAGLFLVEPTYVAGTSTLVPPSLARAVTPLAIPWLELLAAGLRSGAPPALAYARTIFDLAFHDRAQLERAWREQRRARPLEYRRLLLELAGVPTRLPLRPFATELALPVSLVESSNLGLGSHFPALVDQLRALGPDFEHLVVPGGHYLQLDRPGAVTAALAAFAASLDERDLSRGPY